MITITTRKGWAKVIAWVGGAVGILGHSGSFGKYSGLASDLGLGMVAWSTHLASDTSAGHPNGAN